MNDTLITEVLPAATIEQLRRILAEKPSGTIQFHVKDGVILKGEFTHKDNLTILRD